MTALIFSVRVPTGLRICLSWVRLNAGFGWRRKEVKSEKLNVIADILCGPLTLALVTKMQNTAKHWQTFQVNALDLNCRFTLNCPVSEPTRRRKIEMLNYKVYHQSNYLVNSILSLLCSVAVFEVTSLGQHGHVSHTCGSSQTISRPWQSCPSYREKSP